MNWSGTQSHNLKIKVILGHIQKACVRDISQEIRWIFTNLDVVTLYEEWIKILGTYIQGHMVKGQDHIK